MMFCFVIPIDKNTIDREHVLRNLQPSRQFLTVNMLRCYLNFHHDSRTWIVEKMLCRQLEIQLSYDGNLLPIVLLHLS